jgi:anaerobic ribonucleoside-triphosphate reductase activating protein
MNSSRPLLRTDPSRLAAWCLAIKGIDGITLSGGDPFDQPLAPLAEFMEQVRERSKLSVLLFSGRTLDQLRRSDDPLVERCLSAIDILVDGPYIEALNNGTGWRGSSNQAIHSLGPRADGAGAGAATPRRIELIVNATGAVSFTGMPRRGLGAAIAERLEACSIINAEQGEIS